MNSEKNYTAEDIVFEAEMIPTYSDMEMLLSQEGIRISAHMKSCLSEVASVEYPDEAKLEGLTKRVLSGDDTAKGELVEGLMRLVVCAATRFAGHDVPFADLFQEGSLGLVCAVDEYTESDGDIRMTVIRRIFTALEEAVREAKAAEDVPDRLTELLTTVSHSDMVLLEKLGREATVEEIAADSGLEVEKVAAVMEIMEEVAAGENERDNETSENAPKAENDEKVLQRFDFGKYTRS